MNIRLFGKFTVLFLLAGFSSLVLIIEVCTLVIVFRGRNAVLPPTFGNFEKIRQELISSPPPEKDEFSFAAAGDTRSVGTFENICKRLKDKPMAFMVLLGDCVNKGRPGEHEYFKQELNNEMAVPFPVFYLPGNHDLHKETFSLSKWEETYGPSIFDFEYQKCLFIVLRILEKPYPDTKESIAFLEKTLKEKRERNKHVFVFMHRPVNLRAHIKGGFENDKKFMSLCDTYNVDYVIGADFHGYVRTRINNTVYMVAGFGGAGLKDPYLGTHHALIVTVGPDKVYEQLVGVEKAVYFDEIFEISALARIFPWMKKYWFLTLLINLVTVPVWFFSLLSIYVHIKRLKKKPVS